MSDFSNPIFHNETKARKWLEARIWPDGPICPHCGVIGEATLMKGADIDEFFRRFETAKPAPRGELDSINPYTLLVAVVLSAQATDVAVNKATKALFAIADTPAKMVALG